LHLDAVGSINITAFINDSCKIHQRFGIYRIYKTMALEKMWD